MIDALCFGGAEKQVVSLVNNINDERFSVTVGYFARIEDLYFEITEEKRAATVCFDRRNGFDPLALRRLAALIARNEYHVVLCINEYSMLCAYLVKVLCKQQYRLVTAIHHTLPRPGLWHTVKNIFFKLILNKCDKALFVCRNQMTYWIKKCGTSASISKYIFNGIDCEYFRNDIPAEAKKAIKTEYGIHERDIVLGSVAALRPEKRHEDILNAARTLIDEGYSVKVLIVGDGCRRKHIIEYARSIKLSDHVSITGFKDDVRPYLSVIDCLLIASDAVETFSIAALEAMAMSKPVIITDMAGASEMVFDGFNGYLYEAKDVQVLVSKIRNIIEGNMFEAMGRRARQVVTEKFTLERMVFEYKQLFLEEM